MTVTKVHMNTMSAATMSNKTCPPPTPPGGTISLHEESGLLYILLGFTVVAFMMALYVQFTPPPLPPLPKPAPSSLGDTEATL